MKRRIDWSDKEGSPLRRKALGAGLAIAAIVVVAIAVSGEPEAMAPAAVVATAPPAFKVIKSSWGEAPGAEAPPAAAPDAAFTPTAKQDDEARRAAEARERWQNLDIAVTTER